MDKLAKLKLPENADGALITSDINRRYFTGMKSSAGLILKFKECSYLIIDFRYIEKARNTVKNCAVIEQQNLSEQIKELADRHNAKSIAIESMDMTVQRLRFFEEKFPEIEFIKTDELSNNIYDMRTVKTSEEISKICRAQDISEKAFNDILGFISEGVTEREIALRLENSMMENGAESVSFETIALAGANTSMPHGVPGNYRVKKGDFVLMDFGAVFEGYHSDMTRTVCLGQPSEKMQEVYSIVLKAQLAALEKIKAGISGQEMDSYARNVIEAEGFGNCFGHSLGHGVGMEIHEFPTASSKSKTILKENMVVTVEPGIYIPGEFGVRIEDFVVVTENSHVNLTKCPKKLIIL